MSANTEPTASFKRLKAICVPVLNASLLTHSSIPDVLKLLSELHRALSDISSSGNELTPSLAAYVFFPLSSLLRRNAPSAIPDQVMEKILVNLSILIDAWWWDCDLEIWEQLLMLCGAVISGIESKGKTKDRDEETKAAATRCLLALLRERTSEGAQQRSYPSDRANVRLRELQLHAQTPKLVPVLGQTLSALLDTAQSRHLTLQNLSLLSLSAIIKLYAPDDLAPSVLPGVVSGMTKVALGVSRSTGFAIGDAVSGALQVMADVIVRSVGDEICIKEGTIRPVNDLEDLATLPREGSPTHNEDDKRPYMTTRTAAWLRGTSSQLHIAINTLTPLVSHPTHSALSALVKFSSTILHATSLTLPQSAPLLLSFLLSLSGSEFTSIAAQAHESLVDALTLQGVTRHRLLQLLMQMTRDNLAALPRLISSQSDAKVEHVTRLIEAVCRLASPNPSKLPSKPTLQQISSNIGRLLGPSGGIEKWGWTLLAVLEFFKPPVVESNTVSVQLMLETDQREGISFVHVPLKSINSRSTYDSLERMFHSLGRAAGDECLFAVEWFANVGYNGRSGNSVAALWCACRLMEGMAEIYLLDNKRSNPVDNRPSRRLEKVARMLAKKYSDILDDPQRFDQDSRSYNQQGGEDTVPVEYVQGLIPLHRTMKIVREDPVIKEIPHIQPLIHRAFCLQLIAITAGILQAQFAPLLLHTLYPILHSLISSESLVCSTAMATLDYVTASTSYASPANLLLSNFDYALDGVSRRLTKRWLDIDATKVLVLLVRLVGSDVVDKASDIVEECFNRLDEYHGYDVLVDGLVEVLGEVVKAIDTNGSARPEAVSQKTRSDGANKTLEGFFEWLSHRKNPIFEQDDTDYGPAPHQAWGDLEGKDIPKSNQEEETDGSLKMDVDAEQVNPPTPAQALTKQIVAHSLYFLTHGSPVIRARILDLLTSSVPILPETALLPSIHQAWPFILNRLADPQAFVVGAAAALIESLTVHVGTFMFRRIWDDVWPRFHKMLDRLDKADSNSALISRGTGAVGTESAYTHSHRLYRSLLRTMTAAMKGVDPQDSSVWQVIMSFRRFLHKQAHEELQTCARALYIAIGKNNADTVWLALRGTCVTIDSSVAFMHQPQWDIHHNVDLILQHPALI